MQGAKLGRPRKTVKAKNAGFSAYPEEIEAIKKAADDLGFQCGFDYVRDRLRRHKHPATRGKIVAPRMAS
jgi:hypothetical protein